MDVLNTTVLMILGIGVFGGIIGANLFQRIHVPQVVGYIVMGLLIGDVGFGLVTSEDLVRLQPVNLFALGIIGFLVGGELQLDVFRKHGKQLFSILLFEGFGAFFLVGIPVGLCVYVVARDAATAAAAGIVFGAIASATDPASTLNVLQEYRSRGILTTTLIAIVALDDALAMTLYGIGTSTARVLMGGGASLVAEVVKTTVELAGAILLGVVSGILLLYAIRWLKRSEKTFGSALGTILLIIGIAATFEMDVILATMALGVTLTNISPGRSKEVFAAMRSFATPIYVIFFVLVGARLNISAMPGWLWGIVALYVLGRSAGKIAGAYMGGRLTGAAPAVQKYVGLGLFAQGGIAVGLSIMAAQHLGDVMVTESLSLGEMIIFGVTASTLVLQLTGPSLIKVASRLAGELGRDVTEDDVIESWSVADAMSGDIQPIPQSTTLSGVFGIFADNDHLVYPVTDPDGALTGVISLDDLKEVMAQQDTWDWVLANDVMAPVVNKVDPEMPLQKALDYMQAKGIEEVPVVEGDGQDRAVGILDERGVRIRLNREVLRRRQ